MHNEKLYTRRQFLRLSGKGLAALAFLGSAASFGVPVNAQAAEKTAVNTLVTGENEMRVVFMDRLDANKSDAFYILNTTEKGLEVFLIDGGRSNGRCISELEELRADILTRAGLADEIPYSRYVLDITLLISHFHGDHVNELMGLVQKIQRFRIHAAYYPAATALPSDSVYDNMKNDDLYKRQQLLKYLKIYHKTAPQNAVPFGETMDVPTTLGSMRLYASPVDWGVGEHLAWMENVHFSAKPYNIPSGMATEVLNGNCLWARVEYAGRSLLFTGDTNKKFADRTDESLDLFIERYGEELRSDIIKFPHHGRGRDAACQPIKDYLLTDNPKAVCILSGSDGPELAGVALTNINVPWLDLNGGNIVYTLKESGMERIG